VFPIAHNTAPWCFPSLTSILTGRYQKSMDRISSRRRSSAPSPRRCARSTRAPSCRRPVQRRQQDGRLLHVPRRQADRLHR
jgi:hypothetical protein